MIDSAIHPNLTFERQCAEDHLAFSGPNDLMLFDRGYTTPMPEMPFLWIMDNAF